MREIISKIINMLKDKRKGQVVVEYSILIGVVVVVLILSINGPIKDAIANTINNLMAAIKKGVEGLIQ